jgi:peroxiredoxin
VDKRTFLQYLAATAISSGATPAMAELQKPGNKHTLAGVDASGKAVTLDAYANRVCLVSFFTAGCVLCTKDLKLMREFYHKNVSKKFALIGVNLDDTKEDFEQYIHLINLSIPADQRFPIIWRNAGGHQDSFGSIAKKPTHFVLDKEHRQVLHREGAFLPGDWDDLWTLLNA